MAAIKLLTTRGKACHGGDFNLVARGNQGGDLAPLALPTSLLSLSLLGLHVYLGFRVNLNVKQAHEKKDPNLISLVF